MELGAASVGPIYTRNACLTRQRRLVATSAPGWLKSHWLQKFFTSTRHEMLVNRSQAVSLNLAAPASCLTMCEMFHTSKKRIWSFIRKPLFHLLTTSQQKRGWCYILVYVAVLLGKYIHWQLENVFPGRAGSKRRAQRRPSSAATHCPTLALRLLCLAHVHGQTTVRTWTHEHQTTFVFSLLSRKRPESPQDVQ